MCEADNPPHHLHAQISTSLSQFFWSGMVRASSTSSSKRPNVIYHISR